MIRFDNSEVAFDVPTGWEERSLLAFEAPRNASVKIATNVALARIAGATMTPAMYGTQQVARLASALDKFELVSHRSVTLRELPATELLYHWATPDGGVTERLTVFLRGTTLYVLTASTLRGHFELIAPVFDQIARSITFTDAAPPMLSTSTRGF